MIQVLHNSEVTLGALRQFFSSIILNISLNQFYIVKVIIVQLKCVFHIILMF